MDEVAGSWAGGSRAEETAAFVPFALALCGLYASSLYSYLLFHTLVETFCISVMLAVFIVSWNSRRLLDNHYFLFLAVSFVASGTLELMHALSYKGIGIFPGHDANLPTQFWIAFRYLFSLSLLAAPAFVTRRISERPTLLAFFAISFLLMAAVFTGNFPDCFIEGSGLTPFKLWSEYVIMGILLGSIWLLYRKREFFDRRVFRILVFSTLSAIAADMMFTQYVSVYGGSNLLGHLCLALSAFLIYRAIVVTGVKEPAALLFRSLELSKQALKRSNQRLDLLAASAGELLESEEPQQLVDGLCQRVMSYLDCQAFFNYLMHEPTQRLQLNACSGISAEQAEQIHWLDLGTAICGCAARDACRIVAERIPETADPRSELVRSLGIRAYACHPLMSQGRVLGTLSFGTRTRDSFSEDDLSLMKAVADQVSIAMERKLMVENLRQAKQAAEAGNRTKSRFLANMSHELRTPMTGVLGMLDLALNSSPGPQQLECIETAHRSARSLLRILNDILDLSKVEAGKLQLDEKPFSTRSCLEEAVEVVAPEARRKGIELKLECAPEVPQRVVGDQVRLRQVLTNLVGNAVKFTESGAVEVSVSKREQAGEGRCEICFSVRDSGIGIPKDKHDLLFKSFSQVDDSHSRSYGGTGLGLAISNEIVQRMGGNISVESEEGRGSTFSFNVRLEVAPEEAATSVVPPLTVEPQRPEPGSERRLLIAEDDSTIRQVLGTMLERVQFQVEFAEDGGKAVEKWLESDYDVILMDVQMPRIDGFQATRSIRQREQERRRRTPIIAMTAHAMKEDEQRCLDAGMDAYISKPIDFKECMAKIESLIGAAGHE